MIKVTVSEGYAIDMLAILYVKCLESETKVAIKNFNSLYSELLSQFGVHRFTLIYKSEEYTDLISVNREIFNLIDKMKREPIDALIIDSQNYKRYILKEKIQSKYFGGTTIEQKIGYEKK